MSLGRNDKKVLAINAAITTNAATATGNIDTIDYDYCSIDVTYTTTNSATNNPTVLKLSESDDTVVTNFADISGFVGDTDFTVPNMETAATNITGPFATFNVDCRARKRYLKVTISPLTTQTFTALAQLSRGDLAHTAARSGADVIVNG